MTNRLLPLTLCLVSAVAFAEKPKMKPGAYPEKADAWKKFTVLEVSAGAELFKVPGFTCGPDPSKEGFSTYRRTCVKFLDKRCQGRPTKISHIRTEGDLPAGQSCFMDEGAGSTYLDRKFMSPPLSYISIVGTDTSVPRVYEINYTFAKDVLTESSSTGKALIAKYGPPDFKNAPIQMSWKKDDMNLRAECGATEGPAGEFCSIQVSDDTLLEAERSVQKAFDDEQAAKNGPPPPKL
ncbi:MAG: hypothetical protein JNM69_04640 [Archangium sp.]|nr:hypothetical protein [Archangium sp.]